jgi:hypothetical protein
LFSMVYTPRVLRILCINQIVTDVFLSFLWPVRDFLRFGAFCDLRPLIVADRGRDESPLPLLAPRESLSTRAEAREVAAAGLAAIGLSTHVELELRPKRNYIMVEIPTA